MTGRLARFVKRPAGLFVPLAYLVAYVFLSSGGEYVIVNHGGRDWRSEWHPRGLVRSYWGPVGRPKAACTPLGVIFLPLIVVDQFLWHPTDCTVEGLSDSSGLP